MQFFYKLTMKTMKEGGLGRKIQYGCTKILKLNSGVIKPASITKSTHSPTPATDNRCQQIEKDIN